MATPKAAAAARGRGGEREGKEGKDDKYGKMTPRFFVCFFFFNFVDFGTIDRFFGILRFSDAILETEKLLQKKASGK